MKIRKMYVAEYIRGEKEPLEKHGIKVKHITEIIDETLSLIKEKHEKRLEGLYPNIPIRCLTLLHKWKFIKSPSRKTLS